jgi:hypothetical protein
MADVARGRPAEGLRMTRIQESSWASMDILAEVTGGRVTRNTSDLTRGSRQAAADLRGA